MRQMAQPPSTSSENSDVPPVIGCKVMGKDDGTD